MTRYFGPGSVLIIPRGTSCYRSALDDPRAPEARLLDEHTKALVLSQDSFGSSVGWCSITILTDSQILFVDCKTSELDKWVWP